MRQRSADAGDALLSPVALAAIGLLLLNDHFLKSTWPGFVTGKLSDVAGLTFFPLLLLSAWELARSAAGRWRGPSSRPPVVAAAVTVAAFALVKTIPAAAALAGSVLGMAQWALALPIHALAGAAASPASPARVVVDPTDLLALPAVIVAVWVGRARMNGAHTERPAPARSLG